MMKVCFVVIAEQKSEFCREEQLFWKAYYQKYFKSTQYCFDRTADFDADDLESFFFGSEFPRWNLVLAAIAMEEGYEVDLCDYRANGQNLFEHPPGEADIFCFSSFTQYYDDILKSARFIRSNYPKAKFIIGGAHVTKTPVQSLNDGCWDAVFVGESEDSFRRCLSAYKHTQKIVGSPNVLTRDNALPAGEIRAGVIQDLSAAPLPAYWLLPDFYRETFSVKIFCSRGCPFNCAFCATSHHLRNKTVDYVEKEMNLIIKHIRFKEMYIYDDNFFLNPDYSRDIAALLNAKKINWSCRLRADMHTKIPFDQLYKWGCRRISVGGESADNAVLKKMNKRINRSDIERTCRVASESGLNVHLYWMVGLPGETSESARDTVDFAVSLIERNLCNTAEYAIFVPYPGTDIHKFPEKYDLLLHNAPWKDYRVDWPVYDLPGRPAKQIYEDWRHGIRRLTRVLQEA